MTTRVLITGAAGFVGHHLVHYVLKNTDWHMVCLDKLDFSGNLNRIAEILASCSTQEKSRVKIIYHDLRAELNTMIMSKIGPVDFILHLAAGSHVDRSIADPMSFVMDNVVGTVNLLQYARKVPALKRMVYFSTDEIFGPAHDGVSYQEYDRYNATNPYSATKAAGEEMCVAFENTYHLPITIVHSMNVFGERQHPEKFIPLCIKKILSDQEILIHCDPSLTTPGSRHYVHAQDVAEALLFVATLDVRDLGNPPDQKCAKFNLVGSEEIDNLSLAQLIATSANRQLRYQLVDFHSSRPGHDLRYSLDGSLMERLGWKPRRTLTNTIKDLVDWYKCNQRWLLLSDQDNGQHLEI